MGRKVSNQTKKKKKKKPKSNLWDWSSIKKVRPDFFELFTLIGIEFASRIPFLLGQFNTAADVVVLGRLRLRPLQYVPAYSM